MPASDPKTLLYVLAMSNVHCPVLNIGQGDHLTYGLDMPHPSCSMPPVDWALAGIAPLV